MSGNVKGSMNVRRTGAAAVLTTALMALSLAGCGGSGGGSGDNGFSGFKHTAGTGATHQAAGTPKGTGSATTPPPTVPSTPLAGQLPSRLESDGTTILVGDPSAPHTLTLDEDPRCPVCKQFENTNGAQITALARAGKVNLKYTMASFLDRNLGGGGSKRAVNALRAAVPVNGFEALHALIYAHQPAETTDGLTVDYLLELASKVPGLRSPWFDAAVRGQMFSDFVSSSENAFLHSGATGTPTVKIDGQGVPGNGQALFNAKDFKALLAQHGIS